MPVTKSCYFPLRGFSGTRQLEHDFTRCFERRGASRVLCAHDDGYRTCRHFFGDTGDDLARQVDRKTASGLIFGAVGGFEEHALSRVLFVYLDFFTFDDDVISDGERAVF